MALSFSGAETRTACWEERPQVCNEIRLALTAVRWRTPLTGLRGTPRGRCSGPSSIGPRQALLPPPLFPSYPLVVLCCSPTSRPSPLLPPSLSPCPPPFLPPPPPLQHVLFHPFPSLPYPSLSCIFALFLPAVMGVVQPLVFLGLPPPTLFWRPPCPSLCSRGLTTLPLFVAPTRPHSV